jgi:hypothetical protein
LPLDATLKAIKNIDTPDIAIGCSPRKLCYLLPEARQNLANIRNRLDLP